MQHRLALELGVSFFRADDDSLFFVQPVCVVDLVIHKLLSVLLRLCA
jgi:hypothetical protein